MVGFFGGFILLMSFIQGVRIRQFLKQPMRFSTVSYVLMFTSAFIISIILVIRATKKYPFTWFVDGAMLVWTIPFMWALIREKKVGTLSPRQVKHIAVAAIIGAMVSILIGGIIK